jgi:hypothetical protein
MSRIRKNTAKTSVVKKSQTMNSQEGLLRSDNTLCGFTPSGMYGHPMGPPPDFSSNEATITLLPRIGASRGDVGARETGLELTRRGSSRERVGTWNLSMDFASGFTSKGFLAAPAIREDFILRGTRRSQPEGPYLAPPVFSGPGAEDAQLREATEAADAINWFVKGIFTEYWKNFFGTALAMYLDFIYPGAWDSSLALWDLQRQGASPAELLPLQESLISKLGCIKVRDYRNDRWRFYIFPAEVSGRALLRTSKLGPP